MATAYLHLDTSPETFYAHASSKIVQPNPLCQQETANLCGNVLPPDRKMRWQMHAAYLLLLLQLLCQLCHSAGAHLYRRLWERHHRVQS